MPYSFPPVLEKLVSQEMASGEYNSEDEVLLEAMRSLREKKQTLSAICEGLADEQGGHVYSLEDVDAEMRDKYQIPHGI